MGLGKTADQSDALKGIKDDASQKSRMSSNRMLKIKGMNKDDLPKKQRFNEEYAAET